jgi:hypothetical protein
MHTCEPITCKELDEGKGARIHLTGGLVGTGDITVVQTSLPLKEFG